MTTGRAVVERKKRDVVAASPNRTVVVRADTICLLFNIEGKEYGIGLVLFVLGIGMMAKDQGE